MYNGASRISYLDNFLFSSVFFPKCHDLAIRRVGKLRITHAKVSFFRFEKYEMNINYGLYEASLPNLHD